MNLLNTVLVIESVLLEKISFAFSIEKPVLAQYALLDYVRIRNRSFSVSARRRASMSI